MQPTKGPVPPQFAKKSKGKGKRITPAQAKFAASRFGKKAAPKVVAPKAPVDAEDLIDGGADEDKELS